ncbi:MAG: response regulator [Actinomycetota bacterium]|nr:response regulator [Actinomycetota bacterium]
MTKTILVVDDEPVIIELLQVNLNLEGYDVITAANGREALEKAAENTPDLIILDIMMPKMDGWTARAELLKDPATAGVPVIFLTARAQQADLKRGQESKVAAYITKPFEPAELLSIIRQIFDGTYKPEDHPPANW